MLFGGDTMINELMVSVVVPVYNSEDFIKQNVDSVLKQTHQNYELILVDDGSTDHSRDTIIDYARRDKRIKYIFQENQGAPVARNAGIEIAQGDFIYLIDSDDYLAEDAFESLLKAANRDKADIIIGQYDKVNEFGVFLEDEDFGYRDGIVLTTKQHRKELSFLPPFPGNKMYRASMIKDYAVTFASVKIAQDLNFYLKALLYANKVAIIPETIYHYRIRQGSISNTFTPKILDIVNSIKDVEDHYKATNMYDTVFFNNLKFVYYSFQLAKVPQIQDMTDRRRTYQTLKDSNGTNPS